MSQAFEKKRINSCIGPGRSGIYVAKGLDARTFGSVLDVAIRVRSDRIQSKITRRRIRMKSRKLLAVFASMVLLLTLAIGAAAQTGGGTTGGKTTSTSKTKSGKKGHKGGKKSRHKGGKKSKKGSGSTTPPPK